jgi:hypothetical protein
MPLTVRQVEPLTKQDHGLVRLERGMLILAGTRSICILSPSERDVH